MPYLDKVLDVLENPIRRRIIQRLSREEGYPLELSEGLGVQQQLVSKHLKVMEEAEVVEAKRVSSPYGPDRRVYGISKSVSLTIDFSPHLYGARISSFGEAPTTSKHGAAGKFEDRLEHLTRRDVKEIGPYAKLIADMDRRLIELESERTVLLYLKSRAMSSAKEEIQGKKISIQERMVAYHVLDSLESDVREISGSLDIREEVVRRILGRLREESII